MTHAQFRAFHYVALMGGFSAAADALGLTQPAISDQVRKMEQDNDVLLFHRNRKAVSLTPDGEALFAKTRAYFEIEDEMVGQLSKTANRIEKELRIMVDSASHVSKQVQKFHETFPHVRIAISTGNTNEVLERLRVFEADIGVIGSRDVQDEFEMFPLSVNRLVAFARRDLFAQSKQSLSARELSTLPLVMREAGSKTRQLLEEYAQKNGMTLDPIIEAEGREAVREIVAVSDSIGIVSEAELGEDQRIRVLTLDDINLEMREVVVHLRKRRDIRVIRAFMRVCRTHL